MRASDLIGADVLDRDGRRLGVVTDLRCVQDGPLRGAMATPRVAALLVSRRHTGSLLGYDRRDQQGPWLIRRIVRRLHRHLLEIPWTAVASYDGQITLTASAADLTGH
ncbi:MAG TPA: PRC-barrel domain-containing protein [Mycobacteriales bacterium]|nr:PRC-barrel domain-containing protein [Mycobacteriales bacterium]